MLPNKYRRNKYLSLRFRNFEESLHRFYLKLGDFKSDTTDLTVAPNFELYHQNRDFRKAFNEYD